MKKVYSILSAVLFLTSIISCTGKRSENSSTVAIGNASVNVYYFHFTRRCSTCLAVEENARKALEALYPNEVKTGEYSFTSLNLDDANTKEIADRLGIGGQSLVVVRESKKIDITGAAWLVAHDPEKMKDEIKSGIEKVLF